MSEWIWPLLVKIKLNLKLKCWSLVRAEIWSTRGKTSQSRVENKHSQPT